MRELFNFKWDKRTAFNIFKFPFIIVIRIPTVILVLRPAEFIYNWSDIIYNNLPSWKTHD
jgi:hypothetical protein